MSVCYYFMVDTFSFVIQQPLFKPFVLKYRTNRGVSFLKTYRVIFYLHLERNLRFANANQAAEAHTRALANWEKWLIRLSD